MAIGDYYKLAVENQWNGQVFVNVFHFRQVDNPTGGIPNNAAGLIYYWNDILAAGPGPAVKYRDVMPSVVTVYRQYAYCLTNVADAAENVVNVLGTRGTGDLCPPQCATVITWRTANAGRRFRGRSYLGPIREQDQSAGTIEAAIYKTAVNSFASAMMSHFNGATSKYKHVVYSRILATGLSVTSYVIRDSIKTQRRRAKL